MAFAGLDVGTSGCKVVVYDRKGTIVFTSSRKYQELGGDGYREIDPSVIRIKVCDVLKDMGENCQDVVEAMAVTTLGESVVFLDSEDNCLSNSMVTGDKRGIEETRELIESVGAKKIQDTTGIPPSELYGLPKYMWVNKHTNYIKQAEKIMFYEDFVTYLLTGKRMVSYSSACRSMAFDIEKKCWSKELLDKAGIAVGQMSEPKEAGTIIGKVLPEVAEKLHLNKEMIVVTGGHDQSLAALGSGLNSPDCGECGMGTCEFTFLMLPNAVKNEIMMENDLPCVPYVLPDSYLVGLEVTTCGILKNWCIDTFLSDLKRECESKKQDIFQKLDELIGGMETDVMVLPQFGSSGNPDINYDVKGTITGLTIHTKPEEIYLAVLEGFAFQTLLAYEEAKKVGAKVERIICTGGGSKSKVTLQIRANVLDVDVATINSEESGTLGCVILASTAVGAFEDIQDAIGHLVKVKDLIHPNHQHQEY
ncbi:MAG: hypothetical protein K6A30_02010, partial [Lachnospiraceae bacterium]|nr:hypothetical protein [Lachnospiraceae bacterium]